jgi:hypothetical protein
LIHNKYKKFFRIFLVPHNKKILFSWYCALQIKRLDLPQVLNYKPKISIMKKLALVLTVFTASIIGVKAQSSGSQGEFTFGAGINAALPIGDFHLTHSFGIGVHLQGEYAFSDQLKGVATTGYTSFFGKTFSYDDGSGNTFSMKVPAVGQIPVLVGARFYPASSFFVGAQVGVGIFTGSGNSQSGFEYLPQVGYDAGQIQIIGAYDGTSVTGGTLSSISLSAVYKFGGGK